MKPKPNLKPHSHEKGHAMKAQKIVDSKVGNRLVDMMEFTTEKPCKRWLLMFLGTGQLGPADASQLHEMDDYGYQRNLSFECDFNILAPQAQHGYSEFEFTILHWMLATYGNDIEIFLTGHSLGARQVMEYINRYRGLDVVPQVVGAMPVAGEMSGPYPTDPCTCVDIPVMAVHGDKDSAISYYQSKKFVDLLVKCVNRENTPILKIVPGASHSGVMSEVFKFDKESEYYRFIMSCWSKEEYHPIECPATLDEKNQMATFHTEQGDKVYRITPVG